ncbi:MAG: hypothetical protein HLUCCO16_04840 [Phormidium sp. OSCR]|nr:MAG: hypothetical protein HLUCCO16_04840 [Phormidium sp. OSCR]
MNDHRISPIAYLVLISSLLLVLAFVAPQLWSQPSTRSSEGDNSPLVSEMKQILSERFPSVLSIESPAVEPSPVSPPTENATQQDAADQRQSSPGENQVLQKLDELVSQNDQLRFEIRRSGLMLFVLIILNFVLIFVSILNLRIPRFFKSNSPRRERPPLAQDSPSSPSIYGSTTSTGWESRSGTTNPATTSTQQGQPPPSSSSRYKPGLGPAAHIPQPSPKPSQPSVPQQTPASSPSPSISSNEAQNIVALYNKRARELKQNSTSVSIPKETLNQIRSGQSVPMSFTPDNNGNYWLVPSKTSYLNYLVPKEKLVINENTFDSLSQIFHHQNYSTTHARNYRLIEPAQVQQISANQWQLVRRGQIVFG